jgi:hypothetical protein
VVQADEALAYIMDLIPSHHEDMALIEQLDQVLEVARKKARTDLSRNSEASAAIDAGTCSDPSTSIQDSPCIGTGTVAKPSLHAHALACM